MKSLGESEKPTGSPAPNVRAVGSWLQFGRRRLVRLVIIPIWSRHLHHLAPFSFQSQDERNSNEIFTVYKLFVFKS